MSEETVTVSKTINSSSVAQSFQNLVWRNLLKKKMCLLPTAQHPSPGLTSEEASAVLELIILSCVQMFPCTFSGKEIRRKWKIPPGRESMHKMWYSWVLWDIMQKL